MSSDPKPPPVPQDTIYTSCYCEENIYLLAQAFAADPVITGIWDISVVFISNHKKTVALWYQRLARDPQQPVVWDYHVVLVLQLREHMLSQNTVEIHNVPTLNEGRCSWVYDFDTCLDFPCTLQEYLNKTFQEVSFDFQSLLRIIPCSVYLDNFASDRSHMESSPAPPPSYKYIQGAIAAANGISNNLMTGFVCMESSENTYGDVAVIDSL